MKTSSRAPKKKAKSGQKTAQTRAVTPESVLSAVLLHVPFDGWTEMALAAAAKECGLSDMKIDAMFPQGISDVVALFNASIDQAMQKRIVAERGFARMRVREKVGFAVRARLEYLMPHREAMRRLIMWYALPMHAVQGIKLIAKTADLVWQAAGDTSTDYNFYTKRMLLAAVMKATLLYWLNDQSAGCSGTWEFLDRRLAEVVRAGKAISLAREYTPSEVIDMVRKKFAQ